MRNLFTFSSSGAISSKLFEQNVINGEKRSGIVQKEKSTLYLRSYTVLCLTLNVFHSVVINMGGF